MFGNWKGSFDPVGYNSCLDSFCATPWRNRRLIKLPRIVALPRDSDSDGDRDRLFTALPHSLSPRTISKQNLPQKNNTNVCHTHTYPSSTSSGSYTRQSIYQFDTPTLPFPPP